MENVDLQLLLNESTKAPSVKVVAKSIQEQERLKTIMDSIYAYALRKGIESEMKVIRTIVAKNERNLDAIYNFSPLMIHERVVPPIISEARNITQNSTGSNLKTTGFVFKIEKQAEFSTLPPNWRTYLTFNESEYNVDVLEAPTKDLLPKDSKEREQYKKTTIKGFKDGQIQAQKIFEYSLNRLNRDYIGMSRFHEFVIAGKVSMPSITRKELAVISNKESMALDQKLLSIRTLPTFEGNMLNWNTWLEPVQYNPSKQAATINDAD